MLYNLKDNYSSNAINGQKMAKFKFGDIVLFECQCGRFMIGKHIGAGGVEIIQDRKCKKLVENGEVNQNQILREKAKKTPRESGCYFGRKMPKRKEIRIWAKPPIMILDAPDI